MCICIDKDIFMYLCNHENNVSSPRLLHNGFVTTHVLGHMTCDVCGRPIDKCHVMHFFPIYLEFTTKWISVSKVKEIENSQKCIYNFYCVWDGVLCDNNLQLQVFNYFHRELCLRCYWVPGSAFGPSPAKLTSAAGRTGCRLVKARVTLAFRQNFKAFISCKWLWNLNFETAADDDFEI